MIRILLLLLLSTQCIAQNNTMSLSECIDMGLKKDVFIKRQYNTTELASKRHHLSMGNLLPEVNLTANLDYYWQVPVQAFPGEFFGKSSGSVIPIRVGTTYNAIAAVEARWDIVNLEKWEGLSRSKTEKELAIYENQQDKLNLQAEISRQFYSSLLSQKQLAFDSSRLAVDSFLYETAEIMMKEGRMEKMDYNKVKNTLNLSKHQYKKSRLVHENNLFRLKILIGMPASQTINIVDTNDETLLLQGGLDSLQIENHPKYKMLDKQRMVAISKVSQARKGRYPTLSLYGRYNEQSFKNEFEFSSKNSWFSTGLVGLGLSIPLYDSQSKTRINISKLEIEENMLSTEEFEKNHSMQYREQFSKLIQNKESVSLMEENLRLTDENQEIANFKFQEGVISPSDLLDAKRETMQAQHDYLKAMYDLYMAKIELGYLTGNYSY